MVTGNCPDTTHGTVYLASARTILLCISRASAIDSHIYVEGLINIKIVHQNCMVLSQNAATAAMLSIEQNVGIQEVNRQVLTDRAPS